jgi:hypothetical protein
MIMGNVIVGVTTNGLNSPAEGARTEICGIYVRTYSWSMEILLLPLQPAIFVEINFWLKKCSEETIAVLN